LKGKALASPALAPDRVSMRLLLLLACMSACAHSSRPPAFAAGIALIQPRLELDAPTAVESGRPWAIGGGVALPPGTYELALTFDLPREQRIDWTLSCPGAALSGTLRPELAGPSRLSERQRVVTTDTGVCAVTALVDDAGVVGSYSLRRL
jgi:hypothetical protein